jgi:hypothetical protein
MAEQAAKHPRIEAALMATLRAELPDLMEQLLSEMFRGEKLSLYALKNPEEKQARNRRIMASAAAGIPQALIAERESVSERHVRRVVKKMQAVLSE